MLFCATHTTPSQAELQHPFILKLVRTFADANFLFMLLEIAQGGELFQIIQEKKRAKEFGAKRCAASPTHGAFPSIFCGAFPKNIKTHQYD